MYILSEEQIGDLFAVPIVAEQDRPLTFSLNEKEEGQLLARESKTLQIYYILLLGYFKEKPVRLDLDQDTKNDDFEYVKGRYFPGCDLNQTTLTSNQKYKIYKKIFSVVDVVEYDSVQADKLTSHADSIAISQSLPISLFDELMDWLRINNIEIPSYRKLQRIVTQSFNKEKSRVMALVEKNLTVQTKLRFKQFLRDTPSKHIFNNIRFEARDFSHAEIKKEVAAFDELSEISKEVIPLISSLGISKGRVRYYAGLFDELSISRHKKKSDADFNLHLSCFIFYRFSTLIDYLGDAFTYQLRLLEKEAKESSNSKILQVKESMDELLVKAADLLVFYHDPETDGNCTVETLRQTADSVMSEEELKNVISHMKQSRLEKDMYFWEYIDKSHTVVTKVLRPILFRLDFIDAAENGVLCQQVEKLKSEITVFNELQSIDNRLARKNKKHLYDANSALILLRAEYFIYNLVSSRLEHSHWFLGGSTRYKPLSEMLVAESDVYTLIKNVNSETLNMAPDQLLLKKMAELNHKLALVPKRMRSNENESLILETKDGEHKWTIKRAKGEKIVNHKTFEKVPKIDISTVIYTASRDTAFFDEIRHITGKKKTENFAELFIACVIANATRQGVYQMADLCDFSHDTLLRFQSNYLQVDSLRRANDKISNATSKLEIFKHYNYRQGFIHASLDGQKFRSRRTTRRMRYSSKYFGQGKGFYADTLLANHVPINVGLYSLNTHESYNVFDLLYNNSTEVSVDAVSTDTHGVNRFNFALLDLSDWQFAPRYAKANHVFASLFDVIESDDEEGLWTLALHEPIDENAIIEGWDYVKRIIVSLHQKDISQSDLVAKLSRSSPSDKNLKALREYDRLIKATYMLDYANDGNFRQYIQTALNRGEAYHQLQRAFEKVGAGRGFRGKSDAEIDMWYECSRLMANCIIYFNAVVLTYVLQGYQRQGKGELIDAMGRISPVAWNHMLMGGKYAFDHLKDTPDLQSMIKVMLAA
ncbi:MAG: Tn3 family transposase [Cellvibrionaceae bacterium]